jgi:Uma2 family endonuclease
MATTQAGLMSEQVYREFALTNQAKQIELVRGHLREKPPLSVEHADVMTLLGKMLSNQLDFNEYRVRINFARTRVSPDTYYIPDIAVIPATLARALRERPGSLDAYSDPLPLVVEIWSPSTGSFDIREKLPDYQRRGDLEIWYIHPVQRTLTAWRRRPDGGYSETTYYGGIVRHESLTEVSVAVEELFAS